MTSLRKLRIIVAGLVGQYPLGGVAWDYFHYVLGLHQLGHDVYYHEDTWLWPFDPISHFPAANEDFNVNFVRKFFEDYAPQLSNRWHYLVMHERHHGMTADAFAEVARTADIFLNVSGASFFPENLNPKCLKVFLDTDPGYNQIMLYEKFAWSENVERWCKMVADHDRHLTYAENIYSPDCLVPRMNFDWRTTRCVVTLPEWESLRNSPPPDDAPFTTVMTWDWFKGLLIHKGMQYGTKAMEFDRYFGLPKKVNVPLSLAGLPKKANVPLSLAIGGVKAPEARLLENGWKTIDAHAATATPQSYQQFIGNSAGEWSVAKNVYVDTRTGWFSCRTACYLAAGRPAVVEETGWSKFIPSGRGVIAFGNMEQAAAGLKEVSADPVAHRMAAYEIAREYLAPDRVLPRMIEDIFHS